MTCSVRYVLPAWIIRAHNLPSYYTLEWTTVKKNTVRVFLPSAGISQSGHFYLHSNHAQIWTALKDLAIYLSPLDQEHMHTPKQLHNKAVFGRGQWSQPAWTGGTKKALVETGMIRKPLPEPGADSGLPEEVALIWKRKLKITQPFWQHQMLWYFCFVCFEALVFRHRTKYRDGGEKAPKNPAIYYNWKNIFPQISFTHGYEILS